MTIDRLPLVRSKHAVMRLTATNVGSDDFHWSAGNCDEMQVPVVVRPGGAWAGGTDLRGKEARFKRLVLRGTGVGNLDYPFGFFSNVPPLVHGPSTAGGIAYECTLHPGGSVSQTAAWGGIPREFVLPDVPVIIRTNLFFGWYRGESDRDSPYRSIRIEIRTWLRTGITVLPRLLLGEAVDVALTDARFRDWLLSSQRWTFAEVDYDVETWVIGLRAAQRPEEARVTIDARSGRILSTTIR
jgi:hypothetical protein